MGLFNFLADVTGAVVNTALLPVSAVKDALTDDDSLAERIEKIKENIEDAGDELEDTFLP